MPRPRLLWQLFPVLALVACGGVAVFFVYAALVTGEFLGPAEAASARERLAGAAVVIGAVTCGLALWAARRVAGPVEEAGTEAARIAAGESDRRLPTGHSRELDALAEAVHHLAHLVREGRGDAARRRSEQDAVLASMTEGVLAVDTGGRVITLNPSAARLFNMTGMPYQGRTLEEVVRNPDLLRFVGRIEAEGGPAQGEITLGAGPARRHLRLGGARLADRDGRRLGTLVVLSDITRLRELEGIRRDFVANVSHELKTPITAIKGAADTLVEGGVEDDPTRERFLGIIRRQSERLAALISDTLSLARVEQAVDTGGAALAPGPVAPVLESAAAACESQAAAREVAVSISCDAGLSAPMDRLLLEQAVINLLQNAVAYSPPGTPVALRARPENGGAVIEVTDQGPGIAPEHLPRLFERFYRVDAARTREVGGTGLGLAIVKHIALAHRGRVSVDSAPGKGSTFRIHLPAA